MRTLTARQSELSTRRNIKPLEVVKLTTYTDRVAKSGGVSHYFAASAFMYDYGNTGTLKQFEPFLLEIATNPETITHLPTPGAGREVRDFSLTLRNAQDATGEYLLKRLREDENLLFAEIEVAELLLDGGAFETIDTVPALTGAEHLVFFRGEVDSIDGITGDQFALRCKKESRPFDRLVISDAALADPKALGRVIPSVYGAAKRVPLLGHTVGWATTLAEDVSTMTLGNVVVTDPTGFPASGNFTIVVEEEHLTATQDSAEAGKVILLTRGVNSTTPAEHHHGAVITESLSGGATFVVADHECKAVGNVYARNPYNGQVARIDNLEAGTVTLANTTLISGKTLCTLAYTQAELHTLLDALAQIEAVTQQPLPIVDTLSAPTNQTPIVDNTPNTYVDDGDLTVYDFTDPTDAIAEQTFNFELSSISGEPAGSYMIFQLPPYGAADEIGRVPGGSADGTYPFTTTRDENSVRVFYVEKAGGVSIVLDSISRDYKTVTNVAVENQTAEVTAARVGFGLELYADVDGAKVPAADTSYTVAAAALIEHPADILRYMIQEKLGLSNIDETAWALAETDLTGNKHAFFDTLLGVSFAEITARFEFESRAQLLEVEGSAGTEFRLLAANNPSAGTYDFDAAVRTVDAWQSAPGESSLDGEHVFTRWAFLFDPDHTLDVRDSAAYRDFLEVSKVASDISGITTAEMDTSEDRYGRRDHPPLAFVTIADSATAQDVGGYYVEEHRRPLVIATLPRVPYTQAFDLERGDVVSVTLPWWATAKKLRLVQTGRVWDDRFVDLVGVEVP